MFGLIQRSGRRRVRRSRVVPVALAVVSMTAATVLTAAAGAADAAPTRHSPGDPAASRRVQALVARMTLDEKLSVLHGADDPQLLGQSGYVPGVPRLGIPEMRFSDGPGGIRFSRPATALPAPAALGSTFDPELARQYGAVIGRDGRALGVDALLGPMLNIIRVPYAGRNFETYSEDPLVTARNAGAEVTGVQSQGLIATAKHWVEYNQEANRDSVNVNVDEQTMHEIELPAFQAAVEAGAGSVMCTYNRLNGTPLCGQDSMLNGLLRDQWGFKGWVMSDWGATRSTDSITKGLDQEMPTGSFFADPLKTAVLNHTIPMSALDTAVARYLGQLDRFGLLAKNPSPRPTRDVAKDNAVAREIAEQGAVLLRNTGNALPLHGDSAQSIAVIGPTAKTPKVSGSGSGAGNPDHANAPIDTIRARAGHHGTVTYSAGGDLFGEPIPAGAFTPSLPIGPDGTVSLPLYAGYTGKITVPSDGDYRISAEASGDKTVVEFVFDGKVVFTGSFGLGIAELPMRLNKGEHDVRIIPLLGPNPTTVKLGWSTPAHTAELITAAATAAKRARTAVVFAYDDESEGIDRTSLGLFGYQDELISQVAKANPNTVVVLNTGSSIAMPWLNKVKSVLDMWYPGQQGAEATTALLFGDASPAGRLSQTFPAAEDQTPVAGDPKRYPGVDNQETYSEGIEVGYRWYDAHGVKPLFPFGFGLGYTSFSYSDLDVHRIRNGHGGLDVSFRLRNTGSRTGQEVPQVYLGASPDVTAPQAVRSLVGYDKVTLRPGETKRVHIRVDSAQLKYWNVARHNWAVGSGARTVFVGSSSAALQLRTTVDIK